MDTDWNEGAWINETEVCFRGWYQEHNLTEMLEWIINNLEDYKFIFGDDHFHVYFNKPSDATAFKMRWI